MSEPLQSNNISIRNCSKSGGRGIANFISNNNLERFSGNPTTIPFQRNFSGQSLLNIEGSTIKLPSSRNITSRNCFRETKLGEDFRSTNYSTQQKFFQNKPKFNLSSTHFNETQNNFKIPSLKLNKSSSRTDRLIERSKRGGFIQESDIKSLKNQLAIIKEKDVIIRETTCDQVNENGDFVEIQMDVNKMKVERDKQPKNSVLEKVRRVLDSSERINNHNFTNLVAKLHLKDVKTEDFKQKLKEKRDQVNEIKLNVQRKREIRSKVTNLVNSNGYFICPNFLFKTDEFNQKDVNRFLSKGNQKTELEKMKNFNFCVETRKDFQTNVKDIVMGIKDPNELFFLNLTKEEMMKIREDAKYYIQDERYLNSVKYLQSRKLHERLEEEELGKQVKKENNKEKDVGLGKDQIADAKRNRSHDYGGYQDFNKLIDNAKRRLVRLTVKSIIKKQKPWRNKKGVFKSKSPQLGSKIEKSRLKHLRFKSENLMRRVHRNSHIYMIHHVKRRNRYTISKSEDVKIRREEERREKLHYDDINKLVKENLIMKNVRELKKHS